MRKRAREDWEQTRVGALDTIDYEHEIGRDPWEEAKEKRCFFWRASLELYHALVLFAVGEDRVAQERLGIALKCAQEAERVDDTHKYGKIRDEHFVEEEMGMVLSGVKQVFVPEAGGEAWHDEKLGRALRNHMLHTARWLATGERDPEIWRRMLSHYQTWLDFQLALPKDSPEANRGFDHPRSHLPRFVCACVVGGEYELAKQYYRKRGELLEAPPVRRKFKQDRAQVLWLLAMHETGECRMEEVVREALDEHYRKMCRDTVDWFLDNNDLDFAYVRAKFLGLPVEPRGLLRQMAEDS